MAQRAFLSREARDAGAGAVRAIEANTSAEIVVAVRQRSAAYREADYLVGALASLLSLVMILLLPEEFHWASALIDLPVVFAVAALVSAQFGGPRRLLVTQARRRGEVRRAAHAAFHELGVSRTRGRTGLLVYVSLLERRVELVADVGLDLALLGPAWNDAVAQLQAAIAAREVAQFTAALRGLGPLLGGLWPRRDNDLNELPDEVSAA